MLIEETLRRPDFRLGSQIRLADGQRWVIPGPRPPAAELVDPIYADLLRAIAESEDHAERLLAELALAIFLLGLNYELGPDDYRVLLEFEPGSDDLARAQREFHGIARAHLELPPAEWRPAPKGTALGGLRRLFGRLGERLRIHPVVETPAGTSRRFDS